MIKESEDYGLFTDEELDIVKRAAKKPLKYSKKYTPTFVHYDLRLHNMIWGNTKDSENKVYVIDFGSAFYGLPYCEEIMYGIHGKDIDIVNDMGLDKDIYDFNNNLVFGFDRIIQIVTARLTEDYAYSWHAENIIKAKKDTSRNHIDDYVNKCRATLEGTV